MNTVAVKFIIQQRFIVFVMAVLKNIFIVLDVKINIQEWDLKIPNLFIVMLVMKEDKSDEKERLKFVRMEVTFNLIKTIKINKIQIVINNLKIFKTIGQFGSRYCSKDAALGRHISASLSELTTLLFVVKFAK